MTTDMLPEALRLADELDEVYGWHNYMTDDQYKQAAAELRRLHAEVVKLAEQRDELLEAMQAFPGFTDDAAAGDLWLEKMRAAIAKATGEQT